MSSYASFIFLFLFSFLTSFRVSAQDPTYVYRICPNTTTFTRNSIYFTNLRTFCLLSLLPTLPTPPDSKTPPSGNLPTESPDISIALASRLSFAVEDTLIRCPNEKEVVLNYEQCMLSYTFFRDSVLAPSYVYHVCPSTATYTRNNTYFTNLITLLSALSPPKPLSPTVSNLNPLGKPPDRVTGLFLCRGDASPEVCRSCVSFAVSDTFTRCPNEKEVTLYYDECDEN